MFTTNAATFSTLFAGMTPLAKTVDQMLPILRSGQLTIDAEARTVTLNWTNRFIAIRRTVTIDGDSEMTSGQVNVPLDWVGEVVKTIKPLVKDHDRPITFTLEDDNEYIEVDFIKVDFWGGSMKSEVTPGDFPRLDSIIKGAFGSFSESAETFSVNPQYLGLILKLAGKSPISFLTPASLSKPTGFTYEADNGVTTIGLIMPVRVAGSQGESFWAGLAA